MDFLHSQIDTRNFAKQRICTPFSFIRTINLSNTSILLNSTVTLSQIYEKNVSLWFWYLGHWITKWISSSISISLHKVQIRFENFSFLYLPFSIANGKVQDRNFAKTDLCILVRFISKYSSLLIWLLYDVNKQANRRTNTCQQNRIHFVGGTSDTR